MDTADSYPPGPTCVEDLEVPARLQRRSLPAAGPHLEMEGGGERQSESNVADEAASSSRNPVAHLARVTTILLGAVFVVFLSLLEVDVSVRYSSLGMLLLSYFMHL